MTKCSAAILTAAVLTTLSCSAVVKVPEDHRTIQEAIVAASAGDTILLAPGTYVIESNLNVPKKLTIASNYINSRDDADIDATIIKAGAKAGKQWFDIRPEAKGTKIIGLTIVGNGKNPSGEYPEAWRTQLTPVPIPGAVWLLGSGLIGLVGFRRKVRKRRQ